jgi:hypothetical protein
MEGALSCAKEWVVSNRSAYRHWAMGLAIALSLGACAADRSGQRFREGLVSLPGQPVQRIIDDIGPGGTSAAAGVREMSWGYLTIGSVFGDCQLTVTADAAGRISEARMRGSDHDCGLMVWDLRKREARYRSHPGLREREAREGEARLRALVDARRDLNAPKPD